MRVPAEGTWYKKEKSAMEGKELGAEINTTTGFQGARRSLLLDAAAVLRLRYTHYADDANLSPTAAEELACIFEAIANDHPALDKVDRKDAIALAHRLIDDDHPEDSRMWPTKV